MILTHCAACAVPLPRPAKQCSRCKTLYCGPACQKEHWDAGGHDKLCKKIKKGGGAEQFHADKKCKEAVAVAVEKCADDTAGQTCFICTQALHWKTKEGLVRGCSCRGTAGFAHVSCLAEQAKILVAEAEEDNLYFKVKSARWARWYNCSLCEQDYHGVVSCALGWACWKTYVGRPETDTSRTAALNVLGGGLFKADHYADALSVYQAKLSLHRRLGASQHNILAVQTNIANSYQMLGRPDEALRLQRDVSAGYAKLLGEEHENTLIAALGYARNLFGLHKFEEAKSLLRKTVPVARRVLGESDDTTLRMRSVYAGALCNDPGTTRDDLREAATTLEDAERIARRVLGGAHPITVDMEANLRLARAALRAREGDVDALREGVEELRVKK